MPRSEVLTKYTDHKGNELEAHQVGEHFGVRAALPTESRICILRNGAEFKPAYMLVYLDTGGIIAFPSEDLAWFFADQFAINADELSGDVLDNWLAAAAPWAHHVMQTGEKIPYRHWKRKQTQ